MTNSAANQLKLKVEWSLERLQDGNEETLSSNAHFLANIASSQENAAALRDLGVVAGVLMAMQQHAWAPDSNVPAQLARSLNNVFKQDEASCGQARSGGGPQTLARLLAETAEEAEQQQSLWSGGRAHDTAAQLAEALTYVVEVHTDSQVAACQNGAVHAALQLMQAPAAVRKKAAELLRELLAGVASAPDRSVYDAFASEIGTTCAQLHALMGQHSRVFGTVLPDEEVVLCNIISEVVAHPACDEEMLRQLLPHAMALVGVFVHCATGRGRKFPAEIEQSLADAMLAVVAQEKLAAALREDPAAFELLRGFQGALTSPFAAASVKQMLAQLQSFVTAL